jgi:hypothetical protein
VLDNQAGVGLATRSLIQGWRAEGLLDEAAVGWVNCALRKSRPGSPGDWVFALGERLGATRERALHAGSVAELFHAAVDLIDDIQDGDAESWLPELSAALRINTALHLIATSSMAAARLEPSLPGTLHASFCAMLTGQGREIARRDWTFAAYVDVSNRIAGCQIALYLHAASAAAGKDPGKLLAIADPLALLMMIHHDLASADERLLCFDPIEIEDGRQRAAASLQRACEEAPKAARPVVEALAALASGPDPGSPFRGI